MMTIEPVYDPDQPDQVLCYLVINEEDIPIGNYNTIDEARDAIRALCGNTQAIRRPAHTGAPYYPH